MVKLQPSKLAMRVRFPLPAFHQPFPNMKTSSAVALIALACSLFAPVYAAGPAFDKAVQAASRDSKAGLSDICEATFKAVKQSPDEADKIFEAVLAQRTNWQAGEVYAIFRSVLLARPDLTVEVGTLVANHSKNGKNGYDGADSSEEGAIVGAVTGSTAVSPMLARLVDTLYEAALAPGVAESALNMTIAAVAGVYGYSYNSVQNQIGVNTNLEVIPAPADMTEN